MPDGSFVRFAQWWEANRLPMAQQWSPIVLSITTLWVGIWAPDIWEDYENSCTNVFLFLSRYWTTWILAGVIVVSLYAGWKGVSESKRKDAKIESLKEALADQSALRSDFEEAQLAIDYLRVKNKEVLFKLISDYLGHISTDHLKLEDSERVTLFLHDNSIFVPVGRHSLNREYIGIRRISISDSEGCVGDSWVNGGKELYTLPDDETEYLEELKTKYKIDKGVAKLFRMNSKEYCCYCLEEGYSRIGMIVFESTRKGVLDEKNIYKNLGTHTEFLLQAIRRSRKVHESERERIEGS